MVTQYFGIEPACLAAEGSLYHITDFGNYANAQLEMRVIEVTQPGVDTEARWVKKGGKSLFGYKQHTMVDGNGLVVAIENTAANCHDSKPLLDLLDKTNIQPGT